MDLILRIDIEDNGKKSTDNISKIKKRIANLILEISEYHQILKIFECAYT